MTQKAEYMTLKRQALVLQAIAKDISDDEGVFYLSSFACQRSIEAIKQCSADLIKKLKQAEQFATSQSSAEKSQEA